jgi:hypothetical protein
MTLKEKILAAFEGVPHPGDDNIASVDTRHPEYRRYAVYFKGKQWNTIDFVEAREMHGALNAFTPEAFHYFLPAFMLASLESYDLYDLIPESIRVDLEYVGAHRKHFPVRMAQFTKDQKRVITEFLREMERRGAGSSEDAIGYLNEEPEEQAPQE